MPRLSLFLAAGVALLVTPAVGLLLPAAASADPAVVSATIYSGSQAGIVSQTVTVGALSNCPTYMGSSPSPFLLNPAAAPFQPVAGSSWSLDTIVQCGLRIPASALTDVAVQSPQHGFEKPPLSPPDLADPGRYRDPTAPGALPVISLDGGQNQVTYARPERSPSDANARDSFTGNGPVSIAVYENAPPLRVRASAHRRSVSSTTVDDQFAATVTDALGRALAPAGLSWSWTFGDGAASARAAPAHSFPLGRWFVTVVVTDRANGTGGTDTIPVSVDSHTLTGPADQSGAGRRRASPSPSGVVTPTSPTTRHGRTPAASTPQASNSPSPRPSTGEHATSTAATPPATTHPATTPSAAATAAPAARSTAVTTTPSPPAGHSPAPSRRPRVRRVTRARAAPAGRIVRGLLIADVTPVSPAASRLVQVTPAAASAPAIVRAATHTPAGFSGVIAAGLIVTLLGLGAGRELRGRPRRRADMLRSRV